MFTLQSDVGQAILLTERLRNLNCFYLVPQLSLISFLSFLRMKRLKGMKTVSRIHWHIFFPENSAAWSQTKRESGKRHLPECPGGEHRLLSLEHCLCHIQLQFSRSVVSDSLRPHGLQHARLPCPSPTPRACSNSCPLSQWCHPAILSSVLPFSCFNLSQHQGLFQWVSSSHQVTKVLEFQLQLSH